MRRCSTKPDGFDLNLLVKEQTKPDEIKTSLKYTRPPISLNLFYAIHASFLTFISRMPPNPLKSYSHDKQTEHKA